MKHIIRELGLGQLSWYNPLVISSAIALVLILAGPLELIEYKSSPGLISENQVRWFDDLEGDGAAEYFLEKTNTAGGLGIMYYDDDGMLLGQENFDSKPSQNIFIFKPPSVDLNRDGVREVILFSSIGDSIFLNIFDYAEGETLLQHRFITTVGGYNNKEDYSIGYIGASDATGDSVPELYFYVVGHFSFYPRRVFRYDFVQDTLIASVNTGAGIYRSMFHSNGDSTIIVIPGTGYENVPPEYPYPYHDSCSWVFAFNAQLELMWDPMPLVSPISHVSDVMQVDSGFIFIHRKIEEGATSFKIYKLSMNGEIMASREYEMYYMYKIHRIDFKEQTHYMVYFTEGTAKTGLTTMELDPVTMGLKNTRWSKLISDKYFVEQVDINYDGVEEVILLNRLAQQIEIYNAKRRLICVIPFAENRLQYISAAYNRDREQGEMVIINDPSSLSFYITRNKWFFFRHLIWLGYFVLSLVFVSGIFLIQIRRNRRMNMLEKQISRMYLTNLRNQLDPHFTMNALNTVGSYIYKEEKEKAYDMFQRFSALIRSALITSEQTLWSLADELQFVDNYLELQRLRFPELFTYVIDIDNGRDPSQIRIPRLLAQICVENSIKHAFDDIDYKGRIMIRVMRSNEGHVVEIADNGIGLNESRRRGSTRGTSMGLGLIEEQVRLTNQLYQTGFKVEIKGAGGIERRGEGSRSSDRGRKGMLVRVYLD